VGIGGDQRGSRVLLMRPVATGKKLLLWCEVLVLRCSFGLPTLMTTWRWCNSELVLSSPVSRAEGRTWSVATSRLTSPPASQWALPSPNGEWMGSVVSVSCFPVATLSSFNPYMSENRQWWTSHYPSNTGRIYVIVFINAMALKTLFVFQWQFITKLSTEPTNRIESFRLGAHIKIDLLIVQFKSSKVISSHIRWHQISNHKPVSVITSTTIFYFAHLIIAFTVTSHIENKHQWKT